MTDMFKLVLLRGLPGSGKSTIARSFIPHNFVHLETDMYFINSVGEYKFDPAKLSEYHNRCMYDTYTALSEGRNVVVSNTFTQKWELLPYFDIARKYNIIPTVILAQGNFGNIHNVPENKIEAMKKRFEYDISELWNNL